MSLKYRISYKRKDPPLETFDGQTSSIECFPSDGINNVVFEDESTVTNQTRENGNDIRKPEAVNVFLNDKGQNKEPEQSCESDTSLCYPWDEVVFESQEEETKWLSWMEGQLKNIAGGDGDNTEISLEQFKNVLGLKKCFFAERFFSLCDSNHSGTTSIYNLTATLVKVTKGTPAQRLKFLFDVYDMNGDGKIDIDELMTVLRSCLVESSVQLSEDDLENLTLVLFEATDTNNSGQISFEEFQTELEKHPGVIENLTISAAQWLKPESSNKKKNPPVCNCSQYFSKKYISNNLRMVLFYVWYILINAILGGYAAYKYRESNGFIIAARFCGLPLNFNCILILILMLRKTLTFLRATYISHFLPLDHNISFHKHVGVVIGVLSVIHTGAHIGNAVLLAEDGTLALWEILLTAVTDFGTIPGSAMITGWLLIIIINIMIICSMSCVRRSGHFEVFYWTHTLYIPFWILLIFHAHDFWKWFLAPGIIFVGEKISRSKWMKQARYGKTYIEEVTLLPSSVTHLEITRPGHFGYQPGDYIFIQIPAVSKHEWHPFTISSAPELGGRIWIHVRSVGNWTNSLYKYFDQYDPGEKYDVESTYTTSHTNVTERRMRSTVRRMTLNTDSINYGTASRRTYRKNRPDNKIDPEEEARQQRLALRNKVVNVECYIDGPYGTATREIFTTEHAVLIGAGIGVTPMASILQSIMYKYKDSRRECPKCNHTWLGEFTTDAMKLRKVDFIWINRDQKAFEWFVYLLTALEVEQSLGNEDNHEDRIIDMHMYMTAAVKKTEMKGIGLQIALDLMYEKCQRDLITGLKVRTEPGRPDWNKIFLEISSRKKGKVKVFFCGAPQLGKTIKTACEKYSFDFVKENF